MKKKTKIKAAALRVDPYLEGLVSKLLDRLVSLEKKLDTVVMQTSGRVSGAGEMPKILQSSEVKPDPRRDRILYEAICADCHKVCEVPFKPSEDRAVYCKECFARRRSGGAENKHFPVLTPVALPPKPASRLQALPPALVPVSKPSQKKNKVRPSKKLKKKASRR